MMLFQRSHVSVNTLRPSGRVRFVYIDGVSVKSCFFMFLLFCMEKGMNGGACSKCSTVVQNRFADSDGFLGRFVHADKIPGGVSHYFDAPVNGEHSLVAERLKRGSCQRGSAVAGPEICFFIIFLSRSRQFII